MSDEQKSMSLADHLEELRRRLGLCLLAVLAATGASLVRISDLIAWLRQPAGAQLPAFAYFSPAEPLGAYLKVAALAGLALAMPVILWQAWAFVRGGLTPAERRWGLVFIWSGSGLFVAGLAFAYAVLLPMSLRVLLGIGAGTLQPMISIDRYLSFVVSLAFWCGVVFELPALLFLLAKLGIVTPEWLRQQRPYAILVMVVLAAIMTPTTDAVSLLLMAVPMVLLYEVSILVVRVAFRPRPTRSVRPRSTR